MYPRDGHSCRTDALANISFQIRGYREKQEENHGSLASGESAVKYSRRRTCCEVHGRHFKVGVEVSR